MRRLSERCTIPKVERGTFCCGSQSCESGRFGRDQSGNGFCDGKALVIPIVVDLLRRPFKAASFCPQPSSCLLSLSFLLLPWEHKGDSWYQHKTFTVEAQGLCCAFSSSQQAWNLFFSWLNFSKTEPRRHHLGEALPLHLLRQNSLPFLCSLETGCTTERTHTGRLCHGCMVGFQGAQRTFGATQVFPVALHTPLFFFLSVPYRAPLCMPTLVCSLGHVL